jgi:hypothetical protein
LTLVRAATAGMEAGTGGQNHQIPVKLGKSANSRLNPAFKL